MSVCPSKLQQRIALLFFLLLTILSVFPSSAYAMEGDALPPGFVIGDDQGIQVQPDGNYLVEINDVLPGKKWRTDVQLLNVENSGSYELTVQIMPPAVSGPIDFSEAITMTLVYRGEEFYHGPASGISKNLNLQKEPYSLGVYESGDQRLLKIYYEMDSQYTKEDFKLKSMMENSWEFRAVKTSKTQENPQKPHGLLPQTGEEWRAALMYICIGMSLFLMLLLIIKKKKEQK